jgi:hypothetical protein
MVPPAPTRAVPPVPPLPPSSGGETPAGASAQAALPLDIPDAELPPPSRPAARPAVAARKAAASPGRRPGGKPSWLLPAVAVAGAIAVAAAAFVIWKLAFSAPSLEGIGPLPLRAGQRATVRGSGFAANAAENVVTFDDKTAQVLSATAGTLEIEVPANAVETGTERHMTLVVRRGGRASQPLPVSVLQAPRLHGISPTAALPGEVVLLAGVGWGPGAKVRFGTLEAQTIEIQPNSIRAIVPQMSVAEGTPAPAVVSLGGVDSNTAPFVVGRLPLISALSLQQVAPGDLLQVNGLGFDGSAESGNTLLIGGVQALVVAATPETLKVVVPRLPTGAPEREIEIRVAGHAHVAKSTLGVAPPSDPVELRFVAEPFTAVAGRPHAVLAGPFGPAFVFAAVGKRSAAERAVEAQERLNAAVPLLRLDAALSFEARGYDGSPVIGLTGRPEPLLEPTDEDAAAYNEDWTGLKGRGGPVSRARLARWWEAVARDLTLLLVRNERPRFAAALAPEGRVLGQVFDAARRGGQQGVPRKAVETARPPQRDALRLVGLRVPAAVAAPAGAAGAAAAPTPPPPPQLTLDGSYRGRESEDNQLRYVIVTFARGGGSVTYEGGITFAVPLLSLQQPARDKVRFSLRMRGGLRYYFGTWDGEAIKGTIATDPAGREVVGSFELKR